MKKKCCFAILSLFLALFSSILKVGELAAQTSQKELRLYWIDLQKPQNQPFHQSQVSLAYLLLKAAKEGQLPFYRLDRIENNADFSMNIEPLAPSYLDRWSGLKQEEIGVMALEQIYEKEQFFPQYLHLYTNANTFSSKKSELLISFRFADLVHFFEDKQQPFFHNILAGKAFNEVLILDEKKQQELAIFLMQELKKETLLAYESDLEKTIAASLFFQKWGAWVDAPIGRVQLRLQQKKIDKTDKKNKFEIKSLDLYIRTQEQATFSQVARFKWENFKTIAAQSYWFSGDSSLLMPFSQALAEQRFVADSFTYLNTLAAEKLYYQASFDKDRWKNAQFYQQIKQEIEVAAFPQNEPLAEAFRDFIPLLFKKLEKNKIKAYQTTLKAQAAEAQNTRAESEEKALDFEALKNALLFPKSAFTNQGLSPAEREQLEWGMTEEEYAILQEKREKLLLRFSKIKKLWKDPAPSDFFAMQDISILELNSEIIYPREGSFYLLEDHFLHFYIPAAHSENNLGVNRFVLKVRYQDALKIMKKIKLDTPQGKRTLAEVFENRLLATYTWYASAPYAK
ncbi:hypothetical protein [Hugenholtzia roseola]|uniref:hypothetical protein n=1 Tax=Hugenholtzia roseola TaxID=1002 RepID=UPI00047D6143|nr:hypothetical protein [Hugenholtzia roseola]